MKFEAFDRHLGMLLGGLEGVSVGMLATMFVVSLVPATRQPIFSSTTGRVVGTVMSNLDRCGPSRSVRCWLRTGMGRSRRRWPLMMPMKMPSGPMIRPALPAGSRRHPNFRLSTRLRQTAVPPPQPFCLPCLIVSPAGEDQALEASGSPPLQRARAPALDGPQGAAGLDGILEKGRQEVEQAVSDSIDQQLQRLGGPQSATPKGQK